MTGKVIQGSFLTGQPRWSPSVQPKIAPSSFHAKAVAPPATVFAPRPPQSPASARAAQPTALQRHGAGGAFAVDAGALGIASSGGKPLPDVVRGKMETALGADFSNVRVHVGPQAERIGAIAFTTGSDIYFAPGRYQPETIQGQQLLGHELAHVVQQRAGRVRNPLGSGLAVVQDRALEAEADRLGQRAATHRVAVQAKMPLTTAQASAPVQISPPVSVGPGSYRLSAGTGGREIGSVMVHARERGAVEVTDLGVNATQRGNGVGQMLIAAAAKTGMQSGRTKVTLAAQDRGSGHLTRWYKEMGFTQTGVNPRGYAQLEAPISRFLSGVAQRHEKPFVAPDLRRTGSLLTRAPSPTGTTRQTRVQRLPDQWSGHIGRASIQAAFGWGKPGSTPSFLVNQDKGKTQGEKWPDLSGNTSNTGAPSTKTQSTKDIYVAKSVTDLAEKPIADSLDLTRVKNNLKAWSRREHAGCKATLSDEEIGELMTWAVDNLLTKNRNKAVNVLRGEGSGDYLAKDQVKIIAIHSAALSGNKQPTYHVTLKD